MRYCRDYLTHNTNSWRRKQISNTYLVKISVLLLTHIEPTSPFILLTVLRLEIFDEIKISYVYITHTESNVFNNCSTQPDCSFRDLWSQFSDYGKNSVGHVTFVTLWIETPDFKNASYQYSLMFTMKLLSSFLWKCQLRNTAMWTGLSRLRTQNSPPTLSSPYHVLCFVFNCVIWVTL